MDDTICAVATALGEGAISIIKISGKNSILIVNKIYKGKDLLKVNPNTINYGKIYSHNKLIDEVMVSIFHAPKSYTCENLVEINCHGSIISIKKILSLLLENGCRLAEPGEFTKRAFLNGRLDLVEAEAVQNLINSQSEKANKMALSQLTGKLSNIVREERQKLLNILANIEVNIDYPEYEDAIQLNSQLIKPTITEVLHNLKEYLKNSEYGLLIKNGITIAIVGKPNVGKSSILNALSDNDKAIVTEIPGTTRDIIESEIILNDIKITLIDTAGIRKTTDYVENIGVERSLKQLSLADLVIFVLNNNEELTEEDLTIYAKVKQYHHLVFINKTDLPSKINLNKINSSIIVEGNTKEQNKLDSLKNKIIELFNLGLIENKDLTYFSNVRQINLLKESIKCLSDCLKEIEKNTSIELLSIFIKETWDLLGEIIGESYDEELLDKLFSEFCLGK